MRFCHRSRTATLRRQTHKRQMQRQLSGNQSDNLWRNYQSLLYLEDSRDDILHKVRQLVDDDVDQKIRSVSFQEANKQSSSMFEQIRAVFLRLPTLATYDHQLLKICIKIIDKQERRERESLSKSAECDGASVAPAPPKEWRQKCLDLIQSEVAKRVVEVAPSTTYRGEDKAGTKLFIHLTAARDAIKHDVEHAKALSDIFTSEWDMYNAYVMAYYDNLMTQMKERFSSELSETETVEILSWMIYCRDQIFNCPDANCKPCLLIFELQDKFLREKDQRIHDWMERALLKDINDWQGTSQPMSDSHGLYTEFPIDILRMLEESIGQAGDISHELHGRISDLCLAQLNKIMESYTAEAKSYISRESSRSSHTNKAHRLTPPLNLKDRTRKHSKESRSANFVQYSVALLNNFHKIATHLHEMKAAYNDAQEPLEDNSRNNNNRQQLEDVPVQALIRKIETQSQECSDLLLPELMNDLNDDLRSLLTRKWLLGNEAEAVDTMCHVMKTYLSRLRQPLLTWLIPAIEDKLIVAYVKGLTDKRLKLEGKKRDRLQVSDKLCLESEQLERFFQEFSEQKEDKVSKDSGPRDQTSSRRWEVVREMASVLQIDDEETAITEITFLASKYPDMTEKRARRLLKLRGDFTKVQISKVVAASMGKKKRNFKPEPGERTIFSTLSDN